MLNRLFGLGRRDAADAEIAAHPMPPANTGEPASAARVATPESAIALATQGRYVEALAIIDAALSSNADDPHWIFARGSTLFDWSRFHEARTWLVKAAEHGSDHPLLFLRAGWSCIWTRGARSGEPWMRKAVEHGPDDWVSHFGLGTALRGQGRIDDAYGCFDRALALSPDNPHCLSHLFECRYAQGRLADAEGLARRAVSLHPASAMGRSNLGIALIAQDRFDEAIKSLERAASMTTASEGDPHLNLGICLREAGRLSDALALYERELSKRPSIGAQAHYGHALLTAGRLPEGWLHYEFRWLQEPLLSLRPPFRKPIWSGQDLRGKTILLRCEQGVGDVVQFIRYAPHVKALGATVLLGLRKNIGELARSFPGVDRVLYPGEATPEFDYYIHLMSLPRVFDTDLSSIPADDAYLSADSTRMERWAERLRSGGCMKIGLAWAGDPRHLRDCYRSIPLGRLAPLWQIEGVRFFSLQKGPQAGQLASAGADMAIIDIAVDLHDFADTAAVISHLDLVICVDTSVAHLAAALGKDVWVLLPTPADWRWMEHREDSPWYPTMRLFRQTRQGEWDDVVVRVKAALEERNRSFRAGAIPTVATSMGGSRETAKLVPRDRPSPSLRPQYTAAAETRAGILQYWPQQTPIGTSIERYGEFLQRELDVVGRWIRPGSTVVEAAAGVGLHSLFLCSAIGPSGHLLLYEHDPLRKQVLQQNLIANRVGNATLMRRNLGVRETESGATGPLAADTTLTEAIDDLRLEALHWIKVNDDTLSTAILGGSADTLWRLRPALLLAAGDDPHVHQLAASVRDFGYQCLRMETPLFNPDNFNRRPTDVFDGRCALALLAFPEETEIDVTFDHCIRL